MNPKAMYCDSMVGTAAAISLPGLLQSGVIPIWPENEERRSHSSLPPPRGPNLSMGRFRTSVIAAKIANPKEAEKRARAICSAIVGAQLMARSRANIALYDGLIESYRTAGLLPA